MPNWCWNMLSVSGDRKELKRFVAFVKTGDDLLDFNKAIKYPNKFVDKTKEDKKEWKGFNNGGYWWCVNNWGTKWNSSDVELDYDKRKCYAVFSFETAWAPSLGVTEALAKKFPKLTFEHEYEEDGCCFAGISTFKDGKMLEEEEWEIEYDDEEEGMVRKVKK